MCADVDGAEGVKWRLSYPCVVIGSLDEKLGHWMKSDTNVGSRAAK